MSTIVLRGGVMVEHPLELALEFLTAYSGYEASDSAGHASFDESDLRLANRRGAHISAVEMEAILDAVVRSNAPWARSSLMRRWRTRRARSRGSP